MLRDIFKVNSTLVRVSAAATLLLLGGLSESSNAALIVSNWNITGNTLTYDISGTIDPGVNVGSISPDRLYIGVPGDTDWVLANGVVSSVVNHPGASRTVNIPRYLNAFGLILSDYTWLNAADGLPWAAGDSVNASVTAVGGTLVGANIVKEQIIVSAGRTPGIPNLVPEVAHQVGAYIVPEPSTILLLGFVGLPLAFRRR